MFYIWDFIFCFIIFILFFILFFGKSYQIWFFCQW